MDHAIDETGLSSFEAARRLKEFGPNELPNPERRKIGRIVLEVLRQPMFALLLIGALVYLLLGEPLDAVVLGLFATLSVTISIVQESRSEKVLESLRNLASPRALVLRDGKYSRIASRDLVPGDVILLSEGDRVPADGILFAASELFADESLLTGESLPVRKKPAVLDRDWAPPGGEDLPFAFAGSLIVRGNGSARVIATGPGSEMGKIGQALQSIALEQPRLQSQLSWLVRDFAIAGAIVACLVVLLLGLLRGSWLKASLSGIAVGMSVLPEEIPLVLAVFMAMGAWRISRAGVLTRRAAAIETLGSATLLCTDKTGTLTENRMRLALIVAEGAEWRPGDAPAPPIRAILHAALAASAPVPTDPMDRAIHEAAADAGLAGPETLLNSYGLDPDLPATTNIWKIAGEPQALACAKGAPETIAQLCRFSPEARKGLLEKVDALAGAGIRFLAVAEADLLLSDGQYPKSQRDIAFRYVGLVGFADPIRDTVPSAIAECHTAGIRVMMITGDYPATARAIAAEAGIDAGQVLSGDMLDGMSDAALAEAAQTTSVFARIRPQQKLRLVQAFKARGDVVAMTGDGVNDAPALKAAHIGIAMGARGTDVAREASALVLLNDDFASIVATIRLGRRTYDNLRKAIAYIVAVHIPIAGLALLPLFLGLPLILMPIHIALLEMVIDPACSIVFEAETEEPDVMRRPPRRPDISILPPGLVLWAGLQGLAALLVVALALLAGRALGMPEPVLRAFVFTALVLINISLILVNRSFKPSLRDAVLRPNTSLWLLAGSVLSILGLALYWGPGQSLFHFGLLHGAELGTCLLATMALAGLLEIAKARMGPRLLGASGPIRLDAR